MLHALLTSPNSPPKETGQFPLDLHTGRPLTESDYTGCCISTIWPPDDEHDDAWNM